MDTSHHHLHPVSTKICLSNGLGPPCRKTPVPVLSKIALSWEKNKDRRSNRHNYEKTVLYSIKTEDTDLTDSGMCVSVSVIEDRVDRKCVVSS